MYNSPGGLASPSRADKDGQPFHAFLKFVMSISRDLPFDLANQSVTAFLSLQHAKEYEQGPFSPASLFANNTHDIDKIGVRAALPVRSCAAASRVYAYCPAQLTYHFSQ
jgi:hypothetical protein